MYVIIYKDVSGDSGEMRDVTKQQTRLLRDLKTYTKYAITVFGVNKRGIRGPTAETEVTTRRGGRETYCEPAPPPQKKKNPKKFRAMFFY